MATSILATVIEKDIFQFNSVRNPALFKQAFEILMAYPAMEISYTKLLGQLQSKGNVELVKHYLELYEGAFLIKALEKYSPNRIIYWREGKFEVDFVVRRGKAIWAIEVKSGRRRTASGLAAFTARYPRAKSVFITVDDYRRFEADPMGYLGESSN